MLAAAACVSPPPPKPAPPPAPVVEVPPPVKAPPIPPPEPIVDAARHLYEYHEHVMDLPAPALADEIQRLGSAPPDPETTLKLAVALSLTGSSTDSARALTLLQPLANAAGANGEPWRTLATMTASNIADLRRAQERSERQAQQLKDSQRRLDEASQKLEALRAIERSLDSRNLPNGAAPNSR
jgi:hypothetical protein